MPKQKQRKKKMSKYIELDFAKLDIDRVKRRGYSEAVFCECKTEEQLTKIFETFYEAGSNIIGTRANQKQISALKEKFGDKIKYDEISKVVTLIQNEIKKIGEIAICTGGTGDIPIAEEAALTAEFYGSNVKRYYDIGVAGIHRLFDKIEDIKKANAIVAVAGMEGALGGVLAGMVDIPVIAVPTSVGYGASFQGLSALLTMLNSCAEGMTVVNIDNGYNGGYSASQINRLIERKK